MTATGTPMTRFALLPPDRPAEELEQEMLARWSDERLFEQTLERRAGGTPWVFFEGPPTANGRPGIHHVFGRTIKDLFCRHRAMKGYRVARKAGWDTHGLPVEIEVEKQLGINGKQQIEAVGIGEFNRLCRESVFTYRAEWERLSTRIGYWLDYAHPYVTYSNDYVESVWWALKTLHERDRLYRGHKILPYCPRCGTTLSSHEVAQGYEDVEDPSVYIALDVVGDNSEARDDRWGTGGGVVHGRRILVWTTTPWTLVSNAALAVNPDLDYAELVPREGLDRRTVILAEGRVAAVLGEDHASRWELVGRLRGSQMVGWKYRRPLDWLEYPAGSAHEIVVAEAFVSAGDGTGVVHMSPAFGADDYAAGQRHNLAFLQPVGSRGEFSPDLPVVGGLFVKDADALLIAELKRGGALWKAERIKHPYPHCWRCGTPLLNYARTSWFVRTTAYREGMLARNARVDWHPPEVGSGRFGEWLENNVDWALSRDRYWGTPLPIWTCDANDEHVEALGSYAELAARLGRELEVDFDPHKPYIDAYGWGCTHAGCSGTMRRVPEVIDTWFDSGSMPFAQWHFPFENVELFSAQYPGDFIAEGVDQTRGWFYSLLAIATGLGDALPHNGSTMEARSAAGAAPYRTVVVNDMVLDAEGQKMSKSRGNIVDPWAVIARHGVDAVRLFLIASSNVWVPRKLDEKMLSAQAGRFLVTLKNVYSGIFAQYANFGWSRSDEDPSPDQRPAVDRWVLGRLKRVQERVDGLLLRFDPTAAARAVIDFIDDDVANWYVRLNRRRFWDVDGEDNRAAFATLHEVLVVSCRLLAPFAPFVSDWIHRELTGGESVHLAPFGADAPCAVDDDLDGAMEAVRTLVRLGRAAREEAGLNVRQPLSRMVCVAPSVTESSIAPLIHLLSGELNVKRVEFVSSGSTLVTLEARPNFRALGRKFGKRTPLAAEAVSALGNAQLARFLAGDPLNVSVEGESHVLEPEDLSIIRRASGALVVQEAGGFFAALDPMITPELEREGWAREVISRVQRMRKEAGFAVSDRIHLTVGGAAGVQTLVREHGEWIAAEVLATEVVLVDDLSDSYLAMQSLKFDGLDVRVAITRTQ